MDILTGRFPSLAVIRGIFYDRQHQRQRSWTTWKLELLGVMSGRLNVVPLPPNRVPITANSAA